MRRVIDLFERNDIHVHPIFSGIHGLKLDSPDLGSGRQAAPGVRSSGLKWEVMDHRRQVYVALQDEAPEGMSLKKASAHLLKANVALAEGDRLLQGRGYVREIASLMPRLFEEDREAEEAGEERCRTVQFKYRRKGLSAEEVLAEAQWALANARTLWPEAGWKK
jgi:hypothetical protein